MVCTFTRLTEFFFLCRQLLKKKGARTWFLRFLLLGWRRVAAPTSGRAVLVLVHQVVLMLVEDDIAFDALAGALLHQHRGSQYRGVPSPLIGIEQRHDGKAGRGDGILARRWWWDLIRSCEEERFSLTVENIKPWLDADWVHRARKIVCSTCTGARDLLEEVTKDFKRSSKDF